MTKQKTYTQKGIRGKMIIIQDLAESDRKQLSSDLFHLSKGIFGNITLEEVEHYVTYSGAERTYLMKYFNQKNDLVGFFALHMFKKQICGKHSIIFRAQTGLLHNYRRSKANMYFSLFKVIKYRLKYPFRKVYCFITTLSPSMYCVMAKHVVTIYPKYNGKISETEAKSIDELMRQYEFKKDPSGNKWISPVGLTTIASQEEIDFWKNSNDPHIQHYLKLNPDFQKGNGLITLIPFSWSNIIRSSFKVLKYILKKKIK